MARSLSLALKLPLVGVNHLRAHVHSPFIAVHAQHPAGFAVARAALLPHLGIVISGGNSLLVKLDEDLRITVIARTVDDAAGEAFDKGAKLLGLPYPGGALIEQHAQRGDVKKYPFPRGFPEKADLRMSFSGLKTALRYQLEKMSDAELIAASCVSLASEDNVSNETLEARSGVADSKAKPIKPSTIGTLPTNVYSKNFRDALIASSLFPQPLINRTSGNRTASKNR
jgi:N6-L-threonylcarbamoyladenine synthase